MQSDGIHRILSNPMKSIESYEIHRILWNPAISIEFDGIQWNQKNHMKSNEIHRIIEDPMKSIETNGKQTHTSLSNPSLDITCFIGFHRSPYNSVDFMWFRLIAHFIGLHRVLWDLKDFMWFHRTQLILQDSFALHWMYDLTDFIPIWGYFYWWSCLIVNGCSPRLHQHELHYCW